MSRAIHAVFENGVFRPLEKIQLPEHQEVKIIINGDISTKLIASIAEKSRSFDFLAAPREDIYTIKDGSLI